jgi:hypothetical protein
MTAATKYGSPRKLPCGDRSARRTRFPWGEAGVLGEGMDKCSRGARRGMGPSACTRVAEIMSGRAIYQQGAGGNLQRPCVQRLCRRRGEGMVWRMSPYERRRGGNAPPGGFQGRPGAGNARSGQRGSGHSVATSVGSQPDSELGSAWPASWRKGDANSSALGRRVRQHRSLAPWRKARPEKWHAEPRPEPDSGNPTVRDRRGALRNATIWEPGVRPGAKATERPPDPVVVRALNLYPDNRTHGLKGESGNGLA